MLFETTRALFGFVSPPRSSCARTLGRRAYEEGRFHRPGGRTLADETAEDEEMRAVASRLGRKEGRLSNRSYQNGWGAPLSLAHTHTLSFTVAFQRRPGRCVLCTCGCARAVSARHRRIGGEETLLVPSFPNHSLSHHVPWVVHSSLGKRFCI